MGGYGEATMKRCYYSNNYLRYTSPDLYKNDQYGEFDLPHVVIWMGYDFGKGWSVGTEIELTQNFGSTGGFKCRPCLGVKWDF